MARQLWLVLAFVTLLPSSAWALDPGKHISQYAHASWRARDGFFSGTPWTIVQGLDGYIWVGTAAGLLRFDGVRFVPWDPPGTGLPSSTIQALLSASDGSLWIGTRGGLSRWKNGSLTNYPTSSLGAASILEDRQGRIWFGLGLAKAGSGPLCQVVDLTTRCLDNADGVPTFGSADGLAEDVSGNLWIGGDTTLLRWTMTSHTEYRPVGLIHNLSQIGIVGVIPMPDGSLYVGFGHSGPGLGLQHLVQGRWESVKTRDFDSSTLTVRRIYRDRHGALWIGTDHGLYRLHAGIVEHFDGTNGLSDDYVVNFSEDREGNLWVVTSQGVDRFSDTPVVSFSITEGLCSREIDTVMASRDGSLWVGGDRAITVMNGGRITCLRAGEGLPGYQTTSLLEDHLGRRWIGLDDTLWAYDVGRFHRITNANGTDIGFVSGLAEDSAGDIWVVTGGQPRRLLRIEGFAVREEHRDLPMPRRVAGDPTGGVWVGTLNGDLAHYDHGVLQTYRFSHDDSAILHQVEANVDGSVLAATSYGLIGWHKGKQLTLTPTNGLPCQDVYGLAFDADENLWLFMSCGLGKLSHSDVERWKVDPSIRITMSVLDTFDGVQASEAPFVGAARSSDGRLWFMNAFSLQMLDPARLRHNPIPPPVHIEHVVADRKTYPVTQTVRLPALTRDLEIDYVGLSFVAPQKVFFRYRLEGREQMWQEAGTRRQAFYNDLPPGTYHFRVIASNNDGLWNEEGAGVDIVIAPAWYQTSAFVWSSLLVGMAALWSMYVWRMRQVAHSLNTRFDERLAERTRVARDLHDTLLQTVQGSKMVADNALSRPDDGPGLRHAMEQVSTWLGQATTEGRAAVNALRASTSETNDLAQAFGRAIEDCRRQGLADAAISVSGTARELHPVVRDEVYRIGYEAIRNACAHSGGTRLDVELIYNRDLIVRIADNGVGIDPAIAASGKEGHFGLQGMRERAARVGAKLTVESSLGAGTEITLIVPGRVIFREQTAAVT